MGYENPLLSLYVLISWMHCVIANSVRLVPVYLVGLLIMLLLQNYVHYVLSEQRHLGFAPVTLSEIVSSVVSESDSGCIAPLMAKKKPRLAPVARGTIESFRFLKRRNIPRLLLRIPSSIEGQLSEKVS
jgi:hypothetical protein